MLWRNKFTALVNLSKKICPCSNSRKLQDTGSWRTAQFQATLLALHTRVYNTKLLQCGTDAWELLKSCSHIYMGNTGTIPQTLNWSLVLLQNLTFRKHLQVNQASASMVLYRCGSPVWNQMSDFFSFPRDILHWSLVLFRVEFSSWIKHVHTTTGTAVH